MGVWVCVGGEGGQLIWRARCEVQWMGNLMPLTALITRGGWKVDRKVACSSGAAAMGSTVCIV